MIRVHQALLFALPLSLAACGDDSGDQTPDASPVVTPDASIMPDGNEEPVLPTTYTFESRFTPGQSSVSYSGQVLRQVLLIELTRYIDGLTAPLDTGDLTPEDGDIEAQLDFYYQFDETGGATELTLTTTPGLTQTSFDALSSAKDLRGKLAGNDSDAAETQHKDWTTDFVGWTEGEVQTPEQLVRYWMGQLDDLAVDRANNIIPQDPEGQAITQVYVTAQGQDLKQLLQKFLLGAVAFSQAADDYLDDATADKGILVSNAQDGEQRHSFLEHHWDEAYGYFGAARDYGDYSSEEAAGSGGRPAYASGYHDTNEDQEIDLQSEYNYSFAANAAKRDRDSAEGARTAFGKTIFDAFVMGRFIISTAGDTLTEAERTSLLAQRELIVQTWEKVIAATVVHYINATLRDTIAFAAGEDYDFYAHAKDWSEMKGFALSFQFSPSSPLTGEQFARIHELMGDAPVLPGAEEADIEAYKSALLEARGILQDAYAFDAANVGDDTGQNGW